MPERISKVQRWLDLIAYLVGRRLPVPVEELMERLPAYARDWMQESPEARERARRKFERDKDELRALGIPIRTVSYTVSFGHEALEGYQIERKDFYLPYLKLLAEEHGGGGAADRAPAVGGADPSAPGPTLRSSPAGAIEVRPATAASALRGLRALSALPGFPLAGAARSALRKLTFDLDAEGFAGGPVLFAEPPETARAREHLHTLTDALLRRKRVHFRYHGMYRGETTERSARPYGLLFQHSHWYLVAWDEGRKGERIFRVDRMEAVRVNRQRPKTPDYRMPEEPVLPRYRNRKAWELGEADEALRARARFAFPLSLWAERNGYGTLVAEEEDGSQLREFEVRQPHAFLRWILSLEGEADIESPPELREGLRTMARQVAALYGEGSHA